MFVGIDPGAKAITCAVLAADGAVVDVRVFDGVDAESAGAWAIGAGEAIAIDAPDRPSVRPHADDDDLPMKFRPARCAEIALGRERGIWVPWVTPSIEPFPAWMQVGFTLFDRARELGGDPVEVYPHSIYRTLADGRPLPSKACWPSRAARIALLEERGLVVPMAPAWSHDALDAVAAALVARDQASGPEDPNPLAPLKPEGPDSRLSDLEGFREGLCSAFLSADPPVDDLYCFCPC